MRRRRRTEWQQTKYTPPTAKATGADKTVHKALGLSGGIFGASPCAVDVKDGKIIRIRPLHWDSAYDPETFNPWKIEKNGKTLEPLFKSVPAPWSLAYKKRAYSPNRVKYPLKRVDWDPNGERNPQNRGKSKYVRISWDEATDILAARSSGSTREYGPLAILVQGDGHGECKMVHAPHGCSTLLFDKMGGFTQQVRNPDSWEGWYWGSKHVWGKGYIGMMAPADNIVKDITENSDMVVVWGGDPETTTWGFRGPVRQPPAVLLERDRHQAGLHQPRPQLRGRHPRRQVDPGAAEHRRGPAVGHHVRVDHRRHVRQGIRRDPHGRLRQDEGLRARRRGRRSQDSHVGVAQVRRPGLDHQSSGS